MEAESLDFSFGFDNVDFSDRILLLETQVPPQVKTIQINSLILAARSPFFRKLFSDETREIEQRHVILQIKASEEVCFMDLLNYFYSNKLPTTLLALLNLLVMADKYEVASCLRDCSRTLQHLPMTFSLARDYFDLPPSLLTLHTIQPLLDAAKQFLVARFKDLTKLKEEVLNLPLAGIEAVFSSDDLQVRSECDAYNVILSWARKHYPNLEERRGILKTHLLNLVRFPFMATKKLVEEVQTCSDIDPEIASKIVIRALHFKIETPLGQRCLAAEEINNATSRQFVKRAYTFRHVKVVEFETPQPQSIVYLDLKREQLTGLFPEGQISSETFHLGGQEFRLSGLCSVDKNSGVYYFWLLMGVVGSAACTVDYDVAIRKKTGFESWGTGSNTFSNPDNKYLKYTNWNDFIANDCPYFINGILHLRAHLTMKD